MGRPINGGEVLKNIPARSRGEQGGEEGLDHEDGGAEDAQGHRFFSEGGEGESADNGVADGLAAGIDGVGVFEAAGGGIDADVEFAGEFSAAGEFEGDVGHVLADAGGVGDEDLADDQDRLGYPGGHWGVPVKKTCRLKSGRPRFEGILAFAGHLVVNPAIGFFHAVAQLGVGLPAEELFDQRVVAVAAVDALGGARDCSCA